MIGPDDDEDDDNEGDVSEVVPEMPAASISSTAVRPAMLRRKSPPQIQEREYPLMEEFNVKNNAASKRVNKEDDECDLFAKILAKKLRKLPEHDRYLFMYEIDGMFLNKLCGDSSSLTSSISYNHVSSVDYLNNPSTSRVLKTENED